MLDLPDDPGLRRLEPAHGALPPGEGALEREIAKAAGEAEAGLAVDSPVTAVHELRKAFKRLRALLKLVPGRRRKAARALARDLAVAARELSGARDEAALRETVADLAAKSGLVPDIAEAAEAALIAAGEAEEDGALDAHRDHIASLVGRCRLEAAVLAAGIDAGALRRAIADGYGKARRLGRSVDIDDAEALHDLRKAVVTHRYHMQLMTPYWPVAGKVWESELQRLREKLGKHHDLDVLRARLAAKETHADWHDVLRDAIGARQAWLAASAQRLHARLFAERPRAFRARLKAYMEPVSVRE